MSSITLSGMKPFNQKVRELRERRRLSQGVLAERLDVWQSKVTDWERERRQKDGEIKIEPWRLAKLADVLGVPVRYLADPQLDEPPQAEAAEGGLSEAEKLILANARIIGEDEALARILGKPAGGNPGRAAQPADAPAPGRAKTLATASIARKGVPKAKGQPNNDGVKSRK
jgi:transcriptional regulator with XRE-family HTH domain